MSDLQQWSEEEWARHKRMAELLRELAYCHQCGTFTRCFDDCAFKLHHAKRGITDRYNLMMKAREALR